ncbi:alpha/beta hydrolase-fold protein [Pedobacter gandavensis]|uniref:alpha/beta hydrolase-fold protein n=1 Tax=Pedobacter gandavensis TaxID=2679963 RepID=UPI00292FC3F9|nr:alpha/beta hydrolase-fold protein [Pedobacter gandavensis]
MKNRIFILILIFVAIISQNQSALAQDTLRRRFDIGKLDSLNSRILKQKRLIEIFVPEGFTPGSTDKYDVLYVLDGGNWNTGLINTINGYLQAEHYMPSTIVVSIMGIDRNKDLTPTHVENLKTSGGAANFLAFIKEELIPYINQKYPSNGDNTLWGHSFGGLFVINALLNEPNSFKSYIAVDPSLWWDNGYIQRISADKLPALKDSNVTLFMSGREGKDGEGMKIDTMDLILKKLAPEGLTWKSIRYPNETHSSVRLKSIHDGLKFSYGWQSSGVEFHPMNGMVLKDKPVPVWYFADTTNVRYTTDGTIPTFKSAKIKPELYLTGGTTLNVKQFTNRSRYDKLVTGSFVRGKTLIPVSRKSDWQSGGFHYDYYEGEFNENDDFKNRQPKQSGTTNADFGIDKLPAKNNFAVVIKGFLESREEGYYAFVLNANKDSKLYLNDQLLIHCEDSNTNKESPYTYVLPLIKGFYNFRLEYIQKNEGNKLKLQYLSPNSFASKQPVPIPLMLQYRKP